MEKEEHIRRRYGEVAYERALEVRKQWDEIKREKLKEQKRQWEEANPEIREKINHEHGHKGGKYYAKKQNYNRTGLRGERNNVRARHRHMWLPYKKIIAPDSQIHHSWLPGTADYNGAALVEAEAHMQGIIKVIKILDGEIKLFTEKEIREQDPEQYAKVFI
jgi:hypothetical protein